MNNTSQLQSKHLPPDLSDSVSLDGADRLLLEILDAYLEARQVGWIDHAEFVSEQVEQHQCDTEIRQQLPGLLRSVDAINGFVLGTRDDTDRDDRAAGAVGNTAIEQARSGDLVATTLGDYEIVGELGRGGMGVVYEARQISLDRRVALKVLPLSVVLDEQQIARFVIEAQAAAQLHHPNIVPIFSVGREDGVYCYSMPLIEGVSWDVWIAESMQGHQSGSAGRDSFDRVAGLVIQAADALEHAHHRGVIHRDIKPSNLLVDRDEKVWVTDFGLARCRSDSGLTLSGMIVGTMRYMSPEQASGNRHIVDHRSDIYSLGITLYELLTGVHAIDQAPGGNTSLDRQVFEPKPPRRVNRFIPRDLETIVLKAIALAPGDRYQTAGQMADDLRRFLDGKPIHARRPSLVDRFAKWTARHHRTVAVAGLLGFMTLAASLGVTAKFASQQTRLQNALSDSDTNLKQSQRHFRQTREVLDHFGLLAAEELRSVGGAEAIREKLVRDLLKYYENFAIEAQDTPALREDLARTHFRAARIIEELGASEQAVAGYRRAIGLFEQLLDQSNPSSSVDEIQLQLGICRNNIALIQAELGRYDEAMENYRRAMARLGNLTDKHPRAVRELAGTHGNLSLLLAALEQPQAAKRELEHSLKLLQERNDRDAAGSDPSEVHQNRLAIAMTLNNLAFLFQDADPATALRYNDQATEVLRDIVERPAGKGPTAESIRQLGTGLNNRAALLAKLGRRSEALRAYREALALYRDLVERAPLVTLYTEELAITYNNFGRLLTRAGNVADARLSLRRAHELLELLLRRRPDQFRYGTSLGGVLNNLAQLSFDSGDVERALDEYRTSIEQQKKWHDQASNQQSYQRVLKTTYANYERALRHSGRLVEAEQVKLMRTSL